MPKLTVDELDKFREKVREKVIFQEGIGRAKITVHMGTCGIASGAQEIMDTLKREIETKNIKDVMLSSSGCAGLCSKEPMATVEIPGKPPVKYADLTTEKIKKIFEDHVLAGKIVTEYAFAIGSERTY